MDAEPAQGTLYADAMALRHGQEQLRVPAPLAADAPRPLFVLRFERDLPVALVMGQALDRNDGELAIEERLERELLVFVPQRGPVGGGLVVAEHLPARGLADDQLDAVEVGGQILRPFDLAEDGLLDDALDIGPVAAADLDVLRVDEQEVAGAQGDVPGRGAVLHGRAGDVELGLVDRADCLVDLGLEPVELAAHPGSSIRASSISVLSSPTRCTSLSYFCLSGRATKNEPPRSDSTIE